MRVSVEITGSNARNSARVVCLTLIERQQPGLWGGRWLRRHEIWGLQLSCQDFPESERFASGKKRSAPVVRGIHRTDDQMAVTITAARHAALRKTLRQKRQRTKYGGELTQHAPLENALNRRCNHSLRELPAPVRRLFLLFGVGRSAVTRVNNLEVVRWGSFLRHFPAESSLRFSVSTRADSLINDATGPKLHDWNDLNKSGGTLC